MDKNIPHIQLYEIYFENSPLLKSPKIIIRSQHKDENLGGTMEELKDAYNINLIDNEINLIRSLKIAYKIKDKEDDKYQIMNLNLAAKGNNQYLITHSIYGMSILKRSILKDELGQLGLKVYG